MSIRESIDGLEQKRLACLDDLHWEVRRAVDAAVRDWASVTHVPADEVFADVTLATRTFRDERDERHVHVVTRPRECL